MRRERHACKLATKCYLLLALTLTAAAVPAAAQTDSRRLKVMTYNGIEVYHQVDSVTFGHQPLFGKAASELTADEVSSLMAGIYPTASPAVIGEMSADNYVDNNVEVPGTDFVAYADFLDQLYAWDDVTGDRYGANDTPNSVWREYMTRLAWCDYLLEALAHQQADRSPLAGEVRLMRAYLRLSLGGMFVTDFADADIQADITEGLALLGDANAGNARRMNSRAAHALAARYHLLRHEWPQVEQHATLALGSTPAASLRKWDVFASAGDITNRLELYYDSTATANYLVEHAYSLRDRYLSSRRYATNGTTMRVAMGMGGPNWTGYLPAYTGNLYVWGAQDYGIWLFRCYEFFEYTDEEIGIGYVRCDYTPFTAEETLLMRAEARFYQGDTEGCLADLNLWTQSKLVPAELTLDRIEGFYQPDGIYSNAIDMNPDTWSQQDISRAAEGKALLDCILHFRRMETLYDGLRWMDIQRYGISVSHTTRYPYAAQAQTKTVSPQTGYLRPAPATAQAEGQRLLRIHMPGDSVETFPAWPEAIILGGSDAADATTGSQIAQDIMDAPYGWVLHEFEHAGVGTSTLIATDSAAASGSDFLSVRRAESSYLYPYAIISYTPGQEYQLEGDGGLYPVSRCLVRLDMPWEEYEQQSQQMWQQLMEAKSILRSGDTFLLNTNRNGQYFNLSHSTDDADRYQHCPVVPTPTGLRFAGDETLGCSPEFMYDAASHTLTSLDGQMVFTPDWTQYLEQCIMSRTNAVTPETATAEWQQVCEALAASVKEATANYEMGHIFLGRTADAKGVPGLGIVIYTNAAHTRSTTAGVAATMKFIDGTATITVDEDFALSGNAQTLASRSETFLPALQSLAALLAGEYSFEYDGGTGLLRLTKRDTSGLVLHVEL